MKNLLKGVLAASLGLAAVSSAHAQYSSPDLVLGFTGGTSSDVLFDLGTASHIGVGGSGTVDLTTSLSLSLLSGNGYSSLTGKSFGVIGFTSGSGNEGIFSTVAHGFTPPVVGNHSAYNGIKLTINDTATFIDGTGSPANSAVVDNTDINSWKQNVANPGANTFFNNYGNPDVSITGGTDLADLYYAKDNGSAPQLLGSFSLNGSGDLTFTPIVVPEPTTTGLLIGAGVLAFVIRRHQSRRKLAAVSPVIR